MGRPPLRAPPLKGEAPGERHRVDLTPLTKLPPPHSGPGLAEFVDAPLTQRVSSPTPRPGRLPPFARATPYPETPGAHVGAPRPVRDLTGRRPRPSRRAPSRQGRRPRRAAARPLLGNPRARRAPAMSRERRQRPARPCGVGETAPAAPRATPRRRLAPPSGDVARRRCGRRRRAGATGHGRSNARTSECSNVRTLERPAPRTAERAPGNAARPTAAPSAAAQRPCVRPQSCQ